MTNADKIRAMTDEQLSQFFDENVGCGDCRIYNFCTKKIGECDKVWLEWLKQEVEDGH